MSIIYRKIARRDLKDICELIDNAWNFSKYIDNEKCKAHCINAFMRGAIINQNYTEVAEEDGKIIGLIFGKIPKLKGFWKNYSYIPSAIYHGIAAYSNKQNRPMVKSFVSLQETYGVLLKESGIDFDGELEFFIVHSSAQGKGIGKTLWANYKNYCKKNGVKRIYVFTDENCNFGFYDYNKFERIGSKPVTFNCSKSVTFNVFLYERDID